MGIERKRVIYTLYIIAVLWLIWLSTSGSESEIVTKDVILGTNIKIVGIILFITNQFLGILEKWDQLIKFVRKIFKR